MLYCHAYAMKIKTIKLDNGNEIEINIYPTNGSSQILCFPLEHGLTEGINELAKDLINKGVEVWLVGPFTTWFLPTKASSIELIPKVDYAQLNSNA